MSARAFALCVAFILAGCKPNRTFEPEPLLAPADDLVLAVSNNNWSDVVIYMVHDGRRTRFTAVTAAGSASIVIPPRFVSSNGTVQIVVHRIGGDDDYVSPTVSIRMGHTVALTLESNLVRSTVGVW